MLVQAAARRPVRSLVTAFLAWKTFLFLIAAGSLVGGAYDTSSSLALDGSGNSTGTPTIIARLTSWDAVYFTKVARRGYLFEQEWAFGCGLPIVVSCLIRGLSFLGFGDRAWLESAVGILVANVSHLLSALVLNSLGRVLLGDDKLALVGALLHIISPAGLFLSAPYAESTFALLSFTGYLFFAKSFLVHRALTRDVQLLLSGVLFGLATAFRSNGLSHGVPFAWECLHQLAIVPRRRTLEAGRKLIVLGIGGLCVAAGSVVPQFVAYQRICAGQDTDGLRPWCQGHLPSIYGFVQQHYWNNGFLRYWTLSNVPLFNLGAPMLYLMARSGLDLLVETRSKDGRNPGIVRLVQSAAGAQVMVATLIFINSHVQIISRVSSGYPLWYLWLARCLFDDARLRIGNGFVTFMIMYASIQAVLFASFLPPA
ncbi:ER membrane glycoprotein subunit of the GPI transamidase complex-like protein [Coniochaeta pulveracea]|uniref:GPI mannosyltransferase 2 n=1 Tax=Coniochaeta pulveracea TaxID=177199 RepID=A0A420YNB7_9PEZI|nr:ER membrane glycoprotein subunit of the GPI transamidase complex-like protein [Coniochaeta pulveracea]